jgi:murein L,D-transpeptidase YafK
MQLFQDGRPVRTYQIALGFSPEGDKNRQGDGRTPEGEFSIDRRNVESAFHLSLGLDYPHPEDRAQAAEAGHSPGGDIFIHGQPNALPEGFKLKGDWTAGCIAVTNSEMREIWAVAPIGTKVEIRP